MEREASFQSELWAVLKKICSRGPIGGLNLKVTLGEPAFDGRPPDIVVMKESDGLPILIIETKRKSIGRYPNQYKFTPYDPSVIGQALSYAALAKENFRLPATPLFATSNPDVLVLFSPVEKPWEFLDKGAVLKRDYERALETGAYMKLIKEHYLFDDKNPLREEVAFRVLDTAVKIWLKEVDIKSVKKEIGFWLIDRLRYFVEYMDSYYVRGPLGMVLRRNREFYGELDGYARKMGYTNGLADIVGQDLSRIENLSRMMIYVLMNKIIFYKVLEKYYNLPELKPFADSVNSAFEYLSKLNEFFEGAVKVSGDFEQIFHTGLYDKIVIADDVYALFQIDELIKTLREINLQEFSDIIGHVYENLIAAEERHRLGQFYTPRPIAELITKWCIRSGDDVVLGPGCGSGTFEIEAYWRLVEFKTGRRAIPSENVHKKVLKQIYAIDINSFPTQLTVMNLAMKNVIAPVTNLNVVESDFFSIIPGHEILLPYKIPTPEGLKERKIVFPKEGFDAVFGNPPYTRWTEIPEMVKSNIKERLGEVLSKYNLHADVASGREPGIYIHFIMWAKEFLKSGGRLGMIISDSWLQAIYGEGFGRYLLENFKVKALIEISARVFPVPLIGTCIILLEKPHEGENLDDNRCVFLYLNIPEQGSFKIDEILAAIHNPGEYQTRFRIKTYKQGEIPKGKRWLDLIFNTEGIFELLHTSPFITTMSTYFSATYGNIVYLVLTSQGIIRGVRNIGGESFFYLTEHKAKSRGLFPDYVCPLLPSSNYMRFYTFTKEDWEAIKDSGHECYLFLAHKPKDQLPENVKNYITEGETGIFLRRKKGEAEAKTVNRSQASQARERYQQYFYGWYDVGGVRPAPIYIARGVQYLLRFTRSYFTIALDDRILTLLPRKEINLNEEILKALLAFLNSSFAQIQIEARGRTTGGGMLELDIKPLEELLILDICKLKDEYIERLAMLFDELESEARRLGGQDVKENALKLYDTIIKQIDYTVAEILGIGDLVAEEVRTMVKIMMERRLARAAEAKREAIKGTEEERKLERPRKKRAKKETKTDQGTNLMDYI
jgi:type I restriction-modification system DNA methylase subunit